MAGSIYGTLFRVSDLGESHGKGIGVVIDGCPAGLPLDEEDIQRYLDRRKPGQSRFTTARQEGDQVEILLASLKERQPERRLPWRCGIQTRDPTITVISWMYTVPVMQISPLIKVWLQGLQRRRPFLRTGDHWPGSSRSSGRKASGAPWGKGFCLYQRNRPCKHRPVPDGDFQNVGKPSLYADDIAAKEAESYLEDMMARRDSCGGVVECVIEGLPAGVGEPVFDKLDAALAKHDVHWSSERR